MLKILALHDIAEIEVGDIFHYEKSNRKSLTVAHKIEQEIKKHNLTQAKATKILEIPQPRISQIVNGKFQNTSEFELVHCLNKLGYNINYTN